MAGNNKPRIKNKINTPIPAPGITLCDTGTGVGVEVTVAVGVTDGVAVSGIKVAVEVEVAVGVFEGVLVAVSVGVCVKVGGTGVAVFLGTPPPSCPPPDSGGQGVTAPVESGTPQSCAATDRLGTKLIPRPMEIKTNKPIHARRFTFSSLFRVHLPAQLI